MQARPSVGARGDHGAAGSARASAQPQVAVGVELDREAPVHDAVLAQFQKVLDGCDVRAELELCADGLGGEVVGHDDRGALPVGSAREQRGWFVLDQRADTPAQLAPSAAVARRHRASRRPGA
jgi:hypothetical protein